MRYYPYAPGELARQKRIAQREARHIVSLLGEGTLIDTLAGTAILLEATEERGDEQIVIIVSVQDHRGPLVQC